MTEPTLKTDSGKQQYKHGDFLGVELNVGDFVSYSLGESSSLSLGIVTGFTKASIRIKKISVSGLAENSLGYFRKEKGITRRPDQVSKLSATIQELADLPDNYIEYFFSATR